jgi:HK97 gp10 family phage protein
MRVDVKGISQEIKRIENYTDRKTEGMKRLIYDTAQDIKRDQKAKVPVLTGMTRDSIKADISRRGFQAKIGPKGKDGYKANWIEHGTKGKTPTRAQPFIAPSGDRNLPKFLKNAKKELKTFR